MTKRILVTYATKAGSTAGVAERIGQVFERRGIAVDVWPVEKTKDIESYDAVVFGSAIRAGQLLPAATKFLKSNASALQHKPTSVFLVCLTMKDDTEDNRAAVQAYLNLVRALITPAHEAVFPGAMIIKNLGVVERMMMKAMKSPEGDYRRWEEVDAWAEGLVEDFLPDPAAA